MGEAGLHDAQLLIQLLRHEGVLWHRSGAEQSVVVKAAPIPPAYRAVVADLRELLLDVFGVVTPLLTEASSEIAALAGLPRSANLAAARLRKLQKDVGEQGLTSAGERKLAKLLAIAYRLGQSELATPLGWTASFDLPDRDALHGLAESGVFWIGRYYGTAVDDKLKAIVRETMLERGLGRDEAARRLEVAFGGAINRSRLYWRGLAATVATRARSFGALSSLRAIGATSYEYVNPLDERTSDLCRTLDGTVWTVREGIELRDRLLGARNPEEWIKLAPWPKVADVTDQDGGVLPSAELAAKGVAWPPLHFHCRSAIDVHDVSALAATDTHPTAVSKYRAPEKPDEAATSDGPPPEIGLSPEALGARVIDGRDTVTGERWDIRYPQDPQGVATAAALYREAGIDVPHLRPVEVGDRKGIARKPVAAWSRWEPSEEAQGHLQRSVGADLLIQGRVASADLRLRQSVGPTKPGAALRLRPKLAKAPRADLVGIIDPELHGEIPLDVLKESIDKASRLSDAAISRSVARGGYDPVEAAQIEGLIKARRASLQEISRTLQEAESLAAVIGS